MAAASCIYAADSFSEMFTEGKAYGNIKYYYIQTDKQNDNPYKDTSAHANAIGGQIGFETASLMGFKAKATFMTTNGFSLGNPVDTSILGRDNGVRLGAQYADDSFTVLGEALLQYNYEGFMANYGRQVIKTPLIHAKEVRMLPSAVQGAMLSYTDKTNGWSIGGSYLTHFKQRTSDSFVNIVKHALGANTRAITGSDTGDVWYLDAAWHNDAVSVSVYDYYAKDFLNSLYATAAYHGETGGHAFGLAIEGIMQRSIGNADSNLAKAGSVTGGKAINAESISLKGDIHFGESTFMAGYSYVTKDDNAHDSLVLPWDGTPLYTNMITSNDLFSSNYGKGLKADSIYIGGTSSFKIAYTQTYDFTGYTGFKTVLSYMNADNDRFTKGNQQDFNVVLAYNYDKHLSIALKGIWVKNNTGAKADGTVTQLDDFQQYRVIANYKF